MKAKFLSSLLAALATFSVAKPTLAAANDESRLALRPTVDLLARKKTVILGDSITQAGAYVTFNAFGAE